MALPLLVVGFVMANKALSHSETILLEARSAWLEEGDLDEAMRLYRLVVHRESGKKSAAVARVELAGLFERGLDQPVRSARMLEVAHDEDPSHPESAEWLMKAADLASAQGRAHWAQKLWERVADTHPEQANKALLTLGRELLAQGDQVAAYASYQRVALDEATAEERSLARIGMSICLERMGDRDAALAELDELSREDPMWRQRRDRLQVRHEASSGSLW